ncbi:MAG: hypothetical protein IT254_04810 [Chitinophagaceae bacterium]|nr:hypothetical protein [Bacteroidota bacterium]MCC6257621.1 hypothetical protein [Chitinophagaceae bacterium]MCW5917822.1 hypothetical protein [Ferruginibacter sp.]
MTKPLLFISVLFLVASCQRKSTPPPPPPTPEAAVSHPVNKIKITEKPRKVAKVIIVNDQAATKTPDGRYYYDLDGQRYWKNFRTGKYYIYRKGINADPDFIPPAKKD